jgi:hypothetical protein
MEDDEPIEPSGAYKKAKTKALATRTWILQTGGVTKRCDRLIEACEAMNELLEQ